MSERKDGLMPILRLNEEAGHALVTADARLLEASRRANEKAELRFPYLALRYGARGRRFEASDGAWLVTVAGMPEGYVVEQVVWLSKVLASRGMPRLVLEWHLGALVEELRPAAPELEKHWARLIAARDRLRAERAAQLGEAAHAAFVARFDEVLGAARGEGPSDAGELVAAAIADERAGIGGAMKSLLDWLADPARFSAAWIAGVEAAVREA